MSNVDVAELDEDGEYRRYVYAINTSESKVFPTEGEAMEWRSERVDFYAKLGFNILNESSDEDDMKMFSLPVVEEMSSDRWVAYVDVELIEYEKEKDAKS
jgi:hypothetical protein